MKKIVIYQSKYGSSERYAKWLAESAGCQAVNAADAGKINFDSHDIIIFGGALYVGKINGISVLTNKWEMLKSKRLIVFIVGLEGLGNKDYLQSIIDNNFNAEQKKIIKFFHLKGSIDYKKLNPLYKIMMFIRKISLKYKKDSDLSEEEKEFLSLYGKPADFVRRDALKPVEDYIAQIERTE